MDRVFFNFLINGVLAALYLVFDICCHQHVDFPSGRGMYRRAAGDDTGTSVEAVRIAERWLRRVQEWRENMKNDLQSDAVGSYERSFTRVMLVTPRSTPKFRHMNIFLRRRK